MPRRVLVTGGTRGIGLEISRRFKADGHEVAALYRSGEAEAEHCRQTLGVAVLRCDVADFEQCRAAVAQVGPVDILVNNAGVTRDAALHKMSLEQWDEVLRTDLYSVFHMTRLVIEGMRARGFGRIVNIASINGQKGQFGQANYSAAKAGMIGFTKAVALENARKGVTVNAVAPGYIDTAMVSALAPEILDGIRAAIPVGRLGRAEEIARCVAFLAAEDAGFITGATLCANGGQYMIG